VLDHKPFTWRRGCAHDCLRALPPAIPTLNDQTSSKTANRLHFRDFHPVLSRLRVPVSGNLQKSSPLVLSMATHRKHVADHLDALRRTEAITEIQKLVARELAKQAPPKTLPRRLADLARELHRRLRKPSA